MHSRLCQCHCTEWKCFFSRSMAPASSHIWGKVRTDQDAHRVATFSSAILRARRLVQVSHCLPVPAHQRRHLYRQTHRLVEDWYTTLELERRCSSASWRSFCEVLLLEPILYEPHQRKAMLIATPRRQYLECEKVHIFLRKSWEGR